MTRNVSEISEATEFAVNFFDANIVKLPSGEKPVEADGGMKQAAIGWINSIPGALGSRCQLGIITALQYANVSNARCKVIVYVGDGGGTCHGQNEDTYLQNTPSMVTSQNYQRVRINTIGVLMTGGAQNYHNFLKQLASANGGTYKTVD